MGEMVDSRVQIRYVIGTDENGRKQTRTVTYSGVKTGASDEQILNVSAKIANLSSHNVDGLFRVNTVSLA
ncbi:MAG: DUF1659 domain-containing protein [Thermoanaerobacteraceae bacterium]|nr:DUF1659 domain-containing protein [Thermoanaerobacteraceae bacterium]